ncbi:Sds3-like-domain-containing protein [Triangularia verruculosa]|uniref:Sds3-like-domain-containing protein n=1 Tax=Triangularia verruculosa TaxID=2587418 RepID=A0AAN7B1R5_9PEZI|nr:Sds3-like-domain-containing protein [Triangularia verruculosa]
MATGDTVLPLAVSSPPPHLLDNSPSNLSSPLSEVEDKYGDHDEPDLEMKDDESNTHSTPKRNGAHGVPESDLVSEPDADEDSKLSEADVNDSEAETERLFDTPPKGGATRDIVNTADGAGIRRFTDRRERVFERSPSKLQQQLQADINVEDTPNGENSSEDEEAADDGDVSMASSDREDKPTKRPSRRLPPRSPAQAKKNQIISSTEQPTSQANSDDSSESKKRKRSSVAEPPEAELPPKKRAASIDPADREFSADDIPMMDDDVLSTAPQSGEHTAEEDNIEEPVVAEEIKSTPVESVEEVVTTSSRGKKGKRIPVKRRKSKSPEAGTPLEAPDEPPEDADAPSGVPTPQAEDRTADEVDEEAEAAHRNEEELERKKAAWEELAAIEKQFSNFRERLYQERLDQLNREEEMLMSDTPTHHELLAMLQCLEERRAETIRKSQLELQFKMSVLNHRAVAERAQIMSQFYQSVRAEREKTIEGLGQDWYDIQQERRRLTSVIPEYGLGFPATKTQAVRQAVSYTREVSILSGFAKHVGFPAAPAISGVTEEQLEDDLEAIASAREPVPRSVATHPPPTFHQDLTAGFGPSLGLAGEQFIEQTPWLNPRHPAHRQQQAQRREQNLQPVFAPGSAPTPAQAPGPRRHSQQPGPLFSSSTSTMPNGDSLIQPHKSHSPSTAEAIKRAKLGPGPFRRDPGIQAS